MIDGQDLPPLTYLSTDSVVEGVGASQVLPYVAGLVEQGMNVRVHSFEPTLGPEAHATVGRSGVEWHPHRFGSGGSAGGLGRVARGAMAVRGASLVHARSDIAAASAMLGRSRPWVWDVRSFWVDQRIALGLVLPGSRVERVMRAVERRAAEQSAAIITLTDAAIVELARRHGSAVADKATRITTCVDLRRFAQAPMPDGGLHLLLSGSTNSLYDHDLAIAFFAAMQQRGDCTFDFLRAKQTEWDGKVVAAGGTVGSAAFDEMPSAVARSHAGLILCRPAPPSVLLGAMPTKVGEFLATGRPVVATPGVGDLDEVVTSTNTGVIVESTDQRGIESAADRLIALLAEPGLPGRCRKVAEERFDLARGVASLKEVYSRAATSGR
jgi:glycosyltransferase involved in cell wall biosynthesis